MSEKRKSAKAVYRPIKGLDDVKADMSELYEQVRTGQCDLRLASELANITGKYLKAVQLDLATQIFLHNRAHALEDHSDNG